MLNVVFIDYDQVTDIISIMVNDPSTEQPNKREDFTFDALKELLENIDDEDYSSRAKNIGKIITNKGGVPWIESEIKKTKLKNLGNE
jgi:hypothetical protein